MLSGRLILHKLNNLFKRIVFILKWVDDVKCILNIKTNVFGISLNIDIKGYYEHFTSYVKTFRSDIFYLSY